MRFKLSTLDIVYFEHQRGRNDDFDIPVADYTPSIATDNIYKIGYYGFFYNTPNDQNK